MAASLIMASMMDQEKVNILLVDDQPAKLLAYEVILKELGENLVAVASGREALEYLLKEGHGKIAFIKGQAFSSDTDVRWKAVRGAAQSLGLTIEEKLVVQLESEVPTSQPGYEAGRRLLETKQPFTAIFSFNDISAIGAIRALREAGRRVPEDISVIGFDDIHSASFQNPSLTTIRQPLRAMGVSAAETLLKRINAGPKEDYPRSIVAEPELIVRESSGKAAN